MSASAPFIHLRVHSAYSLAEGAIKVGKLLDACIAHHMPAVAITDTNNMFGAMDFCLNAVKKGIQPIIGIQVNLALPQDPAMASRLRQQMPPLVLIAQNEIGYRNLCRLNSWMYTKKQPNDPVVLTLDMLQGHSDGLICLTGGAAGPLAVLLQHAKAETCDAFTIQLEQLFPNRLYIELTRHGAWNKDLDKQLIALAFQRNLPIVATNNVYFLKKEFYEAHDALLCIADGRYIVEEDRRRETPDHYFKSAQEMVELFADIPEAIENTVQIAKRCHFYLTELKPVLPRFPTSQGRTEEQELEFQSLQGLEKRLNKYVFPNCKNDQERKEQEKIYKDRLIMEMGVINKMGFPGYFLIVADYIGWARQNDIPVGLGRGSGAGSVVAWALGIIDIDPIPYRLLFERFLNPERVSMPDFDVDFCQSRRDEVIAYVQEKYGRAHVGQIITFGELKARAVVKDVGRVLQMPYGQVDRISKLIPNNPAKPVTLQEAIDTDPELRRLQQTDDAVDRLLTIALKLEGLYRHASIHAAGIVIGNQPLEEIVPLYQDPRSILPATQFNLKYIEQASLLKFDFLGLKTLTVLHHALKNVEQETGERIDLLALPAYDKNAFDMLAKGQTVGIFQFESSGMQDAMRRVKPDRIEDLIALNALYRPGPMQNIPQYAKVKAGEVEADYPHQSVQSVLEETYGIMVYQEQVMEIAKILAGYTLGGADLLRRAMGKKIKAEMDAQRERFVQGAKDHSGLSGEQANQIFDLMARFADYGFNKSHSAAYALMAYHTAYLKANYSAEFMAALMTLDLDDTDKLSLYTQDLSRMGIPLLPPDINLSMPHFSVEKTDKGKAIRYGLAALKGVGQQAMTELVAERKASGLFKDMKQFVMRVGATSFSRKQYEVLVQAGAFDSFGYNRASLYEAAEYIIRRSQRHNEDVRSAQTSLFGGALASAVDEPMLIPDILEWMPLEKLQREFSAIGFYLSSHPVDNFKDWLDQRNYVTYADVLNSQPPILLAKIAGVVVKKAEKRSDRGRFAFVTISDRTGMFDITVYSEALLQYRDLFEAGQLLALTLDVKWNEQEPRFILRSAQLMDRAVMNSVNHVTVHISKQADHDKVASYLVSLPMGPMTASLCLGLQQQNATLMIDLARPFSLKDSDIQQLRSFAGVDVVMG